MLISRSIILIYLIGNDRTNIRQTHTKHHFHLIFHNFYNDEELDLIWEELNFYTKPDKLLDVKEYLGVVDKTNAKAIYLDVVYPKKYRKLSNILTVNRKIFEPQVLEPFSKLHDSCLPSLTCNYDHTKFDIIMMVISMRFTY